MKIHLLAGVLTLATVTGAQAETLTLDFDGAESGMNVNLGANFIANDLRIVGGYCFRPLSGTPCAAINTGETTVITRQNGANFDVSSYWYHLLGVDAVISVTAKDADGFIVGTQMFDGVTNGFDDQGHTAFVDYAGIHSLTFDNISTLPGNARFDQISVEFEPSPVPVPAAGLMLLTAVGAAAALRRKG